MASDKAKEEARETPAMEAKYHSKKFLKRAAQLANGKNKKHRKGGRGM